MIVIGILKGKKKKKKKKSNAQSWFEGRQGVEG